MPPSYRYIATDLMSGVVREEMLFSDVSFSEDIHGSLEFNSKIDIANPNVTRAILDPDSTLIVAERDAEVVWSGIFADPERSEDRQSIQVHAAGLSNYLGQVHCETVRRYTDEELAQIVEDIMGDLAAKPQVLPIVTPAIAATGIDLTTEFLPSNWETVRAALDRISQTEDGFDWGLEAVWVGSPPVAEYRFQFWFPKRGVVVPEVLEFPGNIADYRMPENGSLRASHVSVVSKSNGSSARVGSASNAGTPRREHVVKSNETYSQAALDRQAAAILSVRQKTVTTMTLFMTQGSEPDATVLRPGNVMACRIDDGYYQFDGDVLITKREITPGDMEAVALDVVDLATVAI